MHIYLDLVNQESKDILYRLLEYSLFEESLNDGNEMSEEALFEYKYFDRYFVDPDRDAFFIRERETNKLLGFVMINIYMQKSSSGHAIAEFLVIPKYRRRNIGKNVAFQCFDLYSGNWEVKPSLNSNNAYSFWKNAVEDYTNHKCEFNDGIFVFNNSNK